MCLIPEILPEAAVKGLHNPELTAMRMEITENFGIKIINDCYNAAPSSVKAALDVLATQTHSRRVAVLGDILEMGGFAKDAHTELGGVAALKADVLVCVGTNGAYIAEGAEGMKHIFTFKTTDEAALAIKSIVMPGDTVLLKASRGMHFEKLFKEITEG